MAKKSMRGNVGAVIAGGVAVAGVAALWYWWWVWYQAQQKPKGAPGGERQTASLAAVDPEPAVAEPGTGGVGFWGNPLPEPKDAAGG